jgi:predicted RND superfamily exporter protein
LSSYKIVQSVFSFNDIYKSLNRAFNGDNSDSYVFPENAGDFSKYQRLVDKMPSEQLDLFISKDKKFSRISSRVLDVGADSIKQMMRDIDLFISAKIDTNIVSFKFTGTGIMVDKNIEYIRDSLLQGLGFALLVISLVMFILYRNIKMLIVALIPNVIPMVIAGAILGFAGIPLEAGTAIVFSIIFGIAVDDTIHVLGRYRLLKQSGIDREEAIKLTLLETGKAVTLTSVLLFFGFAILLFSSNPPAVTIGLLISVTLFTALLADVFLLPVLLRLMRI